MSVENSENNGQVESAENESDQPLDEEEQFEDAETEEDEDDEDEDDFFASLTPDQIRMIRERQEALKQQYTSFSKKKEDSDAAELVSGFGLTEDEARAALECCEGDEIECKRRLAEEQGFVDIVRDTMYTNKMGSIRKRQKRDKSTPSRTSKPHDPQEKVKIEINLDASASGSCAPKPKTNGAGFGDLEEMIRLQAEKSKARKSTRGYRQDGEKRAKSLRLTEAIALLQEKKKATPKKGKTQNVNGDVKPKSEDVGLGPEDSVTFDGITYYKKDLEALDWSEARIKSFLSINSNPNSYYYRFNAPGEDHKTGEWTKDEIDLFMDLIKDGCNYRWGEFSMKIAGRVGYQCSNFYRKLIQDGVISDPNYVNIDGKLKFLGKDGKRFSRKQDEAERKIRAKEEREARQARKRLEEAEGISTTKRKKKPKKKKSKMRRVRGDVINANDCDSSEESDDSSSEDEARGNELIKGLQCPMTMSKVRTPTVSPYGHIMSYDTWLKVLNRDPRNTCPFTNQKLTRRMLVKLDQENIMMYQEEIKKVKPDFSEKDIIQEA